MRNREVLNNNIALLNLDKVLTQKLYNLNIYKVEDLWSCSRSYLKSNQINNNDISQIKIKLQLIGLDLNNKKY